MTDRAVPPLEGCPTCGPGGMYWSDPGFGSFGLACLTHRLFWVSHDGGNGEREWDSMPLTQAFFPRQYRHLPYLRRAAGWEPTDLTGVGLVDLQAEVRRRKKESEKEDWRRLQEQVGPCPECDALLAGYETKVIEELRTQVRADPEDRLPFPALVGATIGAVWETVWRCSNDHETVRRDTRLYAEPLRDLP